MRRPTPLQPGPGQESVWDYPRPPQIERVDRTIRVEVDGIVIADAPHAIRILETSHPPTYYVSPDHVDGRFLAAAGGGSFCEWKGIASYFDVVVDVQRIEGAAWCYPDPSGAFSDLANHLAFYPALVACFVDNERVRPQPGQFYGGWITDDVVGPFKGEPGTQFW
ncbi:MAG: DUF427 domain-containing protein [Actinomycetota bacterium]